MLYTGGVYDRTTEQYYLNARYYSPDGGNFLTQDSYRGTQVNYTDPSGHFAIAGTVTAGWGVYELGCLLVGAVVAVATGY